MAIGDIFRIQFFLFNFNIFNYEYKIDIAPECDGQIKWNHEINNDFFFVFTLICFKSVLNNFY